jgi:hypothetical protein
MSTGGGLRGRVDKQSSLTRGKEFRPPLKITGGEVES